MNKRIIQARNEGLFSYLKRVASFRRLIFTLAQRDLKAKYAQTVLGLLWSALQPLTGLLVFTLFFKILDGFDTDPIPYPLFAFSGMLSWYYFTFLVAHGGTSLLNSQDLIKKIYFPKLVLPITQILVGLVEFCVSLLLLLVMMFLFGETPNIKVFLLPIFMVLNIMIGLTVAIWLSALTIRYRDFQHFIPYLINFGIWLTPVFYPSSIFPPHLVWISYMNPMAGVISGFRWCFFGGEMPSFYYLISIGATFILLLIGLIYFRRVEKSIADLV